MALNGTGGMVTVTKTQLSGGISHRWDVEYVSTYAGGDGPLGQVKVMAAALWKINRLLRQGTIRLMHVHSASRGSFWRKSFVCALARHYRVPYVFQLHSGEFPVFFNDECSSLSKAWVRKTLRGSAAVIALTEQWRRALLNIEPQLNIEVLPNPVSVPETLSEKPATATKILYLGRLTEKKGVFDLVKAMPAVLAQLPHAEFIIAGDGAVAATRKLASQLGVENQLDTPGWIDGDAKELALTGADILVLPSYFEGLPVCVLEGMARGIPVVATRVGGIPDVICSETNGLLLEPGDIAGLSKALVELLTTPERREHLRLQAYVDAKTSFSTAVIDRKLEAVYRNILASLPGHDQKKYSSEASAR